MTEGAVLSAPKYGTRRRVSLQVDLQRKSRNVRARDNASTLLRFNEPNGRGKRSPKRNGN